MISSYLSFVIYAAFSLAYILLVADRIHSFKKCLLTGLLTLVTFLSVHYYLYLVLIPKLFMFYFPITGLMIGMFYSIYISPHDGAKAVFPFLVSIFFISVSDSITDIIMLGITYQPYEAEFIQCICLLISATVTYFFLKNFFVTAMRYSNSGWLSMDMSFFIYFFIMYMMIITLTEYNILPIRVGLEILMLVIFTALCMMTSKSLNEQEETYQHQMIVQQIRAFSDQAAVFWENEKKMSILRHDMRHRIGLIRELLQEGRVDEVYHILEDTDDSLEKSKTVKYCENVYVNAALAMCGRKASDEGIRIEFRTDIRENIPIDVHSLAVVISNLVENGMNACMKLSEGDDRFIKVVARDTGASLIINIFNSFDGNILLDDKGYPVSKKEGHGIGTKSVIAFVEKYDGLIDYSISDRVFSVKILVNY
ncbi:MAG: GHKL domain-containing protein [Anaerovoracaceae bacterium]|nr:GHKL domain-containing protein [Anaerovoracaceae bacterium]